MNNRLEIEIMELTEECKWLSMTEKFKNGIPSGYDIYKGVCNIGATHLELVYKERNSIMIEPNTPVLEGKRDALDEHGNKLYPNILVVYKGTSRKDVIDYLQSDITPKKLLSTPEGYSEKIKPAFIECGINHYEDYFMLLDESDRLIKDVDFRPNITAPMKDFFKFKEKAMISATAIEPSDERFKMHNFKILKIVPQFDIKKNLELVETNNILFALKEAIERYKNQKIFIFINSTQLIHVLIKRLKIEEQSKVFCASKSVRILRKLHFEHATSKLGNFKQYNFLTSRNYSAVDIKLDEKPNIIMITDVLRKSFTMLHPYTDTVQIIGRFRNGFSNAMHITNFDMDLIWKEKEHAIQFINEGFSCYLELDEVKRKHALTEGGSVTGDEAINGTKMNLFVDLENGKLNRFMLDNYVLEQEIISNYTSSGNLVDAYKKTGHFKIKRRKKWYDVNDGQLLLIEKGKLSPEMIEALATMLFKHHLNWRPNGIFTQFGDVADSIKDEHPIIHEIFESIGYFKMADLKFKFGDMNRLHKKVQKRRELINPIMVNEIHELHKPNDIAIKRDCRNKIQQIFTNYGIEKEVRTKDVKRYFEVSETTITGNLHRWRIVRFKK